MGNLDLPVSSLAVPDSLPPPPSPPLPVLPVYGRVHYVWTDYQGLVTASSFKTVYHASKYKHLSRELLPPSICKVYSDWKPAKESLHWQGQVQTPSYPPSRQELEHTSVICLITDLQYDQASAITVHRNVRLPGATTCPS